MCRIPRIVVGFALIVYAVINGNIWFFLGVIPFVTGLMNICPLEKLFGNCKDGKCDTSSNSSTCCSTDNSIDKENKCCDDETSCSTNISIVKIEILGTGCANCKALYEVALNVTKDMKQEFEIIKVEDLEEIMKYSVVSTPALVINGEVKSTGRLLNTQAMKEIIEQTI